MKLIIMINSTTLNEVHYWTHGYKFTNTHTILSCNFLKHGHKREATRVDNMGGSQANKELCEGAATLNNKTMFEDCRTSSLLEPHETTIVDSGCTGHFLLVNAPCLSKVKYQNPLTVRLPNGSTMESTHTSALDIPELKKAAYSVHVSQEWITIIYFQLVYFATRATLSPSGLNRSQFSIHRAFKF
jgi:hypothetical protein